MIRKGTCIEDVNIPVDGLEPSWISTCGCGKSWPLGRTQDVCDLCVLAQCNHAKAVA